MHQVVIGTILGDGYLYPRGILQVEHAKKDQQYILWKHKIMGSVVSGPLSEVKRLDKRNNKNYYSYRFYTKPVFSQYRTLFYPNGKKIVPNNVDQLLNTPLALATLFMDDGGKGGNTPKGMVFNFSGFDNLGQLFIKLVKANNFIYQVVKIKNF